MNPKIAAVRGGIPRPASWSRWMAVIAVGLGWWLAAIPAAAQKTADDYALIFGTVWSAAEHPYYRLHVRLRRAHERKFRWEAWSDHRGEFAIRVPVGPADYVLAPDYRSGGQPMPERTIHIDGDERVDLGVHLPQ